MSPLTWQADTGQTTVLIAIHGRPDDDSVTALRAALQHHCSRQSGHVVLDLSELDAENQALVKATGLPAGRSSVTCGTALLIAGEPRTPATGINRHRTQPQLSGLLSRAHEAVSVGPLRSPSLTEDVLPVKGAGSHGRDIVTRACVAWDQARHVTAATVIATELINYTLDHAPTMMGVTALLHQNTLYFWVRGGTRWNFIPDPDTVTSLGLLVLHAVADHWGVMAGVDETMIWAALPAW